MEELIKLIHTLGFPIFVCLWFMWRVERRLDSVTTLLQRVIHLMATDDEIKALEAREKVQ